MRILALETSCDETSAAVIEKNSIDHVSVKSNITASSLSLHAKSGGIIPENAAREQVKVIIPTIVEALITTSNQTIDGYLQKYLVAQEILKKDIDAIAVTIGPGLIGSLLVGVETAKTLGYVLSKPLIPVNHLLGHIYANFIEDSELNDPELKRRTKRLTFTLSPNEGLKPTISFPFIALIVSGNHTDLLFFESHETYQWLGGTRDDAAGEAFDKIGRLLGLSYPAGPDIARLAQKGDPKRFLLPRPMLDSPDFDFSFSGLKTSVLNLVKRNNWSFTNNGNNETMKQLIADLCASVEIAIVDVLVAKTLKAAVKFSVKTILLGGGVSANQTLRDEFERSAKRLMFTLSPNEGLKPHIFSPKKKYCTDNAAMIGAWAAFHPEFTDWRDLQANPELYFDNVVQ